MTSSRSLYRTRNCDGPLSHCGTHILSARPSAARTREHVIIPVENKWISSGKLVGRGKKIAKEPWAELGSLTMQANETAEMEAACHCGTVRFRVKLTDGFNTARRGDGTAVIDFGSNRTECRA